MGKKYSHKNIDDLIDRFVEKINESPRESLFEDEVPDFLREGFAENDSEQSDNYYGLNEIINLYRWKIQKSDFRKRIEQCTESLPVKLPPSFMSLVTRYAFPAFELSDSLFFFGNTGRGVFYEFTDRLAADPVMSQFLLNRKYIQFGNPRESFYDPICFDGNYSRSNEYPIVQIDHEEILCNEKLVIVKTIAPSFTSLIEAYLK